jgi:hypothetical protein
VIPRGRDEYLPGSGADTSTTAPSCTGNLALAARTSDGAFCANFFGLNVSG